MTISLGNRAKMSTSTTGTGTITLGSAISGYQSFANAGITNGQTVRYAIEDGTAFEIGSGTYTSSGTTLTRSVTESSNSDSAITLSGNAEVFVTATVADLYINDGASTLTTTGVITGGTLEATTDTAAGDNAAIGYTAAEGLILTGQGSTSDITLKNDADAVVFTVPTGADDILFPDGAKAMFGAGSDLQIYHNGSASYISDQGTGNLVLGAADSIIFQNAAHDENMLVASQNGAVSLYYDNSVKLATTSGGAHVTGALSATTTMTVENGSGTEGVQLRYNENGGEIALYGTSGNTKLLIDYLDNDDDGNGLARYLNLGAGSTGVQLGVANASNTGGITFTTGNSVTRQHINAIGDIFNYATDGSTVGMFWDASENALNFSDNSKATFGAGSDLQIFHDGTHSRIDNNQGDLFIQSDTIIRITNSAASETAAKFFVDGAVELYHDNSKKIATTATGVSVTGSITCNNNINIEASSGYAFMEMGGPDGAFIDFKAPFSDDYDGRVQWHNGDGLLKIATNSDNAIVLQHNNSTKLATTSTGVAISGVVKPTTYQETYVSKSAAATVTCDLATGTSFSVTLDQNTTFAFTNPPSSGTAFSFTLFITQHSTAVTLTWPNTVDWAGGSAPDAAGANELQAYAFFTRDGGTTYYGFLGGTAIA